MTFGFLTTGVPGLAVVAFFDFWSERIRRRSLRRFCAEIEQSSTPAAVGDVFVRLWCVNLAFLRAWGLSNSTEVRGRWFFEFLEDTERERCAEIYRCLQTGRTWEGRLVARRRAAAPALELTVKVAPYPGTGFARWTFLPGGLPSGWPAANR